MSLSDSIRRRSDSKNILRHEHAEDIQNPWPGLAAYSDPFCSVHRCVFCGRDKESFDVTRMIDDNILVTLYGRSGNGKTSLLNAGVFPRLRQMQYVPISVRLGTVSPHISFQEVIINGVERTIREDHREEVWGVPPTSDREDSNYLWSYFARHRFYSDTNFEREVYPVIVFDQFEEVYRNRKAEAETLLRQISFMMDRSHEVESHELEGGTIYEYQYNFRFVISIREDDLYLLEDSIDNNYFQDMKRTRYRLLPITEEGAREVILKPAEKEHLFAEEDKESIVNTIIDISKDDNGRIGSNVLSLICNRIYALFYAERGGKGTISLDFVEKFVSDNPLEIFYLEATRHLTRKQRAYLEDTFVDAAERRGAVSRSNFDDVFKENGESLLNGPLRILQESNEKVELIHDSFCRILLDQKAKRKGFWRTIAEHVALAFVCAVLCFLSNQMITYMDGLKLHGWQVLLSIPIASYVCWGLFLFVVIGAFRHFHPGSLVWYAVAYLLYPLFFVWVVKDANPLPALFYPSALLLGALLVGVIWQSKKEEKMERADFWAYLDIRSLRIWLFVFMFVVLWILHPRKGDVDVVNAFNKFYSLAFLVPLFFSIFDEEEDSFTSILLLAATLPLSFLLYYTSGTEYLRLASGERWEFVLVALFSLGMPIWFVWSLAEEENVGLGRKLLWILLFCAVFFGFYSLFYRHKLAMLIIGCVVFYGAILYLIGRARMWPVGLMTVVFAVVLHILMAGYSPAVRGIPDKEQDSEWWWRNVIVQEPGGYRLRDAIDGADVLGFSFSRHDGRYTLTCPLRDSLDYSANTWLFSLPGDDNEFAYCVYPAFEAKVHKLTEKGDIVAQVFSKSRQQLFDALAGRPSSFAGEEDAKANFLQLLADEERETIRLLEEGNVSVVKNRITRQLCKGISCSWLANSIGKDMSVGDPAFFPFLAAFSTFVNAYYREEFASEGTEADWDGYFEKMMKNLRSAAAEVDTPHDTYLEEVLPRLIDRYYDSDDYGQDNLLWVEIVRLQQLAVLYGLGDNEWAHKIILSPVVEELLGFYSVEINKRRKEPSL